MGGLLAIKAALANGKNAENGSSRRVTELERELGECHRVIGELNVVYRISRNSRAI